jgi:uncharacterized protein YgiB involved in biofilm formation
MRSRKSTATLTLVLIGAAALSACGGKPETATRDVYRNAADCKRDWGDDDRKCERQSSGTHSGYYYGPSYGHTTSSSSSGTTLAPRSGSSAMSSTTVSRGGFGSSSSSHSSSGS